MLYLTDLINKPVEDINGKIEGTLQDLIASFHSDIPHPEIVAVIMKNTEDILITIPYSNVEEMKTSSISLKVFIKDILPYKPGEKDLYLARDVLDRQIIDANDVKLECVNDLELMKVNESFYVANVDIGGVGLLKRLGITKVTQKLAGYFGKELKPGTIAWHDVELLPGDELMRLKVPSNKIPDLHPADLAEIISDLSRAESNKILESLDVKTVADTLEEIEPEFQATLVEAMADERVADVLEEMAPDDAADLLAELPEDRSKEILKLMEVEEAADVRKLLTYHEDTAGGIMTTEFVAVLPDITAEKAISVLRETGQEAETLFYIYVTDKKEKLEGVFSLKDLVLAQPDTLVSDFMHRRIVSVKLTDSQDKVAQLVAKYNLLAVPVIDNNRKLHGIVTADDALDKIIPTSWKKRLPRMYQ
jgi:CBS domain-containing protein